MNKLCALELCAGGGGMALGLERAGFRQAAFVEIDADACLTLRRNRPRWNVIEADITEFDATPFRGGVDLVAGGLPCPPFSRQGMRLGNDDERDLFPHALRIIAEVQPKAALIENVQGLLDSNFDAYRASIAAQLADLGYVVRFELLNARNFGLPQNRSRVMIVALQPHIAPYFQVPAGKPLRKGVGSLLFDLMQENNWAGAEAWRKKTKGICPTLIGGSKKHLGLDLGPSRTKPAWAKLGIDSFGIADKPPAPDFEGIPKLTLRMCARLQGFPDGWEFVGRKKSRYGQIANAVPPTMVHEIGIAISAAIHATSVSALKAAKAKPDATNAERQRRFREHRKHELRALRNDYGQSAVIITLNDLKEIFESATE